MRKTARRRRSVGNSAIQLLVLAVMLVPKAVVAGEDAPRFADFPSAPIFHGRNAAPILATRDARRIRTKIRDAARSRPNFAGRYIVTTWGCGADCEMGAIIDAISGRVVPLPVVAGSPADGSAKSTHFDYRLDSRLLVMNGMVKEAPPMGSHFLPSTA